MTRQEIIDAFKTELSKTYVIRTTRYENGEIVNTEKAEFPNNYLNFQRPVIEATLALLEEQYDL